MCQDCNVKHPSFALPPSSTAVWCSGCAKGHPDAASLGNKPMAKKRQKMRQEVVDASRVVSEEVRDVHSRVKHGDPQLSDRAGRKLMPVRSVLVWCYTCSDTLNVFS
jgi:hypothetical protein